MPVTIAHQYGDKLAGKVAAALPGGVGYIALGADPLRAWTVPDHAEILLINQLSAAVGLTRQMPRPPGWPFNLKWVHLRSTGIDKYPDWIFEVPKVTVTRGGYATPISEYVLAAMLTNVKSVPDIWAGRREEWRSHKLGTLEGQVLGIVGFGEIGRAIARRALAFDMRVIGTNRSGGPSGMDGVDIVSFDALLPQADHIVVATPLTEQTRGLFDAGAFSRIKPGAHVVNIGRGPVIDTDALRIALDSRLGSATLDVTDPEPLPQGHWLYAHPQVRISPHISGSSPHSEHTVTRFFIDNLDRYLAGRALSGLVDGDARY